MLPRAHHRPNTRRPLVAAIVAAMLLALSASPAAAGGPDLPYLVCHHFESPLT